MKYQMRDDERMSGCDCMPEYECRPQCQSKCIGTYTTKHRIYENCRCEIRRVCSCCGHEYDESQYNECPMCGAPTDMMSMDDPPMDDPPRFGGFGGGFGGRFGGFGGRFGGFGGGFGGFGGRRFGFGGGFGFFPFFPFFPFRGFRRRRF